MYSNSQNSLIQRNPYVCQASIRLTLGLVLGIACCAVAVSETRQLGSHEHGAAILNVAIADESLSIEYRTPAANIVGFEHAPSTEAQVQAVHDATELDYSSLLSLAGDLGQIGTGSRRGYICQNVLAVEAETGQVLGLVDQILLRSRF